MYNPFSLKEKTILLTGASSGIGRTTAIECSKMGAHVIITGRNSQRLRDTFRQLEGENNLMYSFDLSEEKNIELLVSKITTNLDGIVHCAGLIKNTPFK